MGTVLGHGWWLTMLALAGSTPASAQLANEVLTVSTTVPAQCRVQADDLDLGFYTSSSPSRATSTINLQCSPGVVASIALSGGQSGDPTNRTMRAGGDLHYQLYQDEARTRLFADRNPSEFKVVQATGLSQRILVYGEAPAGQQAPEGLYVDVVVVTVTY